MTNNPYTLSSEWGDDFQATNQDAFGSNLPGSTGGQDRFNWWSPDVKIYNPKMDVQSQIRAIPWPGIGYFAVPVRLHEGLGPEKNSCPCPKMLGPDQPCPLCRYARECYSQAASSDPKDPMKLLGNSFISKERWLMWIVDRQNPIELPQIARIPKQTIESIRNLISDPRTGAIRQLDNLDAGFDIFFRKRKGDSLYPMWHDIQIDPQPSPLGKPEQLQQWLPYIKSHSNLSDILVYLTPEQMDGLAGTDPFDASEPPQQAPKPAPTPPYTPPQPAQPASVPSTVQNTPVPPPTVDPAVLAASQQYAAQPAPVGVPAAQPAPVTPAPAPAPAGSIDVNALKEQLKNRPKA